VAFFLRESSVGENSGENGVKVDRHAQYHRIHDAVAFKAQSTSLCFGLFGVAMKGIELQVLDA